MTERQYQQLCARAGISPLAGPGQRTQQKYNASKKTVDGITFDSTGEARAWSLLRLWEQAGVITELERQPSFTLADGFRGADGRKVRSIRYVPDFQFVRDGRRVVVDFKGLRTQAYRIKAKLFQQKYPDLVFEEWDAGTLKENGV